MHIHYFIFCTFRLHHDTMIALCLCLFHGAEATAKLLLLIEVLLLCYSAAGWPGLWPLRPYLDFGATGAPTFNFGVYLGFYTSPSPSGYLQSLALHWGRLRQLCQVWPHIQPWGPLILFSKASILEFPY